MMGLQSQSETFGLNNSQFVLVQAVCYLRPTRENIARLRRELRDPRYGEYSLCACEPILGALGHAQAERMHSHVAVCNKVCTGRCGKHMRSATSSCYYITIVPSPVSGNIAKV